MASQPTPPGPRTPPEKYDLIRSFVNPFWVEFFSRHLQLVGAQKGPPHEHIHPIHPQTWGKDHLHLIFSWQKVMELTSTDIREMGARGLGLGPWEVRSLNGMKVFRPPSPETKQFTPTRKLGPNHPFSGAKNGHVSFSEAIHPLLTPLFCR